MEIELINKYINNFLLENKENYLFLNKIKIEIEHNKQETNKLYNKRNCIIKKKKSILKYFLLMVINTIFTTLIINLVVVFLNFIPNALFYLLISFIGNFYIFINKYIKIKYHSEHEIKVLDNKINELRNIREYNKIKKQKIINKITTIDKKINFLNEINNYLIKKSNFEYSDNIIEKSKIKVKKIVL